MGCWKVMNDLRSVVVECSLVSRIKMDERRGDEVVGGKLSWSREAEDLDENIFHIELEKERTWEKRLGLE